MRLYLIALVACTRSTPAPALSSVAPASTPPTRTCITRSANELDPPSADSIRITGDVVTLCFGVEPQRSCWRVDTSSKQITAQPVAAALPARPVATAKALDGKVKVCGGGNCITVALPGFPAQPEWVAVSPDLATVAVPEDVRLRIYDVGTAKLRATIDGWADSPMAGDRFLFAPTFAGPDRMIVWYAWTPVSEQGRILDLAGKQLAIVGKEFSSLDPDETTWLHDTEWAVPGEADEILTVDVNHPNATAKYELDALFALPRPENDHHMMNVLAMAGTAKRLIVVTGENPVTIGVVNRATNAIEKLEPPRCSAQ